MIKFENTHISGFEAAIRGMRNPFNSWDKSDSGYVIVPLDDEMMINDGDEEFVVGSNDLDLMRKLIKSGSDHAKFLRMINVTVDITAPLYWWKEFDTYKVGTVANSCSTMHTIHKKEFELEDFSTDHLSDHSIVALEKVIDTMNDYRDRYLISKDKNYWWQLIQLLPASFNQRRTVQLNYQTLFNIYKSRKGHKLDEWNKFRDWEEDLFMFYEMFCEGDEA